MSENLNFRLAYEIRGAIGVIRNAIAQVERLKPGEGLISPTDVGLSLMEVLVRLERADRRFQGATSTS